MPDKDALRRTLLLSRRSATPDLRASWNEAIRAQIINWWSAHRMQTLGVYWPIRGEPNLQALYAQLSAAGVRLALPVVMGKDLPLRFSAWQPGDALIKDALGVSIPAQQDFSIQPEALLVPCVGFNRNRFRLGYGGGFYDRTLALAPRPFTVGVSYANALTAFDAAAHDIALDIIITESAILSGN